MSSLLLYESVKTQSLPVRYDSVPAQLDWNSGDAAGSHQRQFDSPEILRRLDVRLLEVPALGPALWAVPSGLGALLLRLLWSGGGLMTGSSLVGRALSSLHVMPGKPCGQSCAPLLAYGWRSTRGVGLEAFCDCSPRGVWPREGRGRGAGGPAVCAVPQVSPGTPAGTCSAWTTTWTAPSPP